MRASIKLGRVWGIELGLHFSWIVIALLIVFSLAAQFHHTNPEWGTGIIWTAAVITGVLFFAAIFAHELSHAFVAKLRGLPIHQITLFFLGGVAQIEREASDPKTEFWMGIAGPIMSVLVGLGCLGIAIADGWRSGAIPATPVLAVLVWLGYINLLLAAFNMIPGFPLDGGRVLRAIIWWITKNEVRSTRIAARVGQVVAVIFIVWGIWRFFMGAGLGGLWLAFIGWFLMQAASASYMQIQAASILHDLRVGELMSRDCTSVDGNSNLQNFVHQYLLRTGRRCFVVLEQGRMTGIVTPHEIKEVSPELWTTTRVHDVMRSMDRIHAVSPDTPVVEALQIMGREDINQLPVVSDGRLEGILSRSHVLQVLQSRAELAA